MIGGVVWLPLSYLAHLATEIPGASAVTVAYAETFFSAGFVTMFLVTVGSGLVYYTVVKELDVPLASRQLALVGFWSLGFAAAWWGAAQLLFGPGPGWVAGVAAALGLAFPIGALANAANISMTLEGSWGDVGQRPAVLSGVLGSLPHGGRRRRRRPRWFPLHRARSPRRPSSGRRSSTSYWPGSGRCSSPASHLERPRVWSGAQIETVEKARRFQRLIVAGSVGVLVFLGAAGILSGYSWIAGSNSGCVHRRR